MPDAVYDDGGHELDVASLVYVEISIAGRQGTKSNAREHEPLPTALAKLELLRLSHKGVLYIERDGPSPKKDGNASLMSTGFLFHLSRLESSAQQSTAAEPFPTATKDPMLFLHSHNPLNYKLIACCGRGFALSGVSDLHRFARAMVTEATIVRVVSGGDTCLSQVLGELPIVEPEDDILHNHDHEAIKHLEQLFKRSLARVIATGTTDDALRRQKCHRRRSTALRQALNNYTHSNQPNRLRNKPSNSLQDLFQQSCIIVHSPHHGHGKTKLVSVLARSCGCERLHLINPGPLLAKYGIHADKALETIVHQAALAAAVNNQGVCIILDQIDDLLPASMSGKSTSGDAASPVFNGIAAYLKTLSQSLSERSELPFPQSNPLYNCHGRNGVVLKVRLCLVAISTCPDDGYLQTKRTQSSARASSLFDCMHSARFRLPDLSAKTRLAAFQHVIQSLRIKLEPELHQRIPFLAASAVWVRGRSFQTIAQRLATLHTDVAHCAISIKDFTNVLTSLREALMGSNTGSQVEFMPQQLTRGFDSVGGNEEAKDILAESLLLDEQKQLVFSRFGLKPPVGVLLYGPPGTGKTLLAKAVAKILSSHNMSSIGGAFVSVSSQDVVNGEVGTGEKTLKAAFETARANAPAVVFVDEFQALFIERSRAGSGRLSSTLIHCMDDLCHWNALDTEARKSGAEARDDRVLVLAATNTPWMIDKAFLRPGRFDRTIYISLPARSERIAILRMTIMKMKHIIGNDQNIEDLCDHIGTAAEGFSGADLVGLCRAAAIEALRAGRNGVALEDYVKALADTKPSTPQATVDKINKWSVR